MRFANLFVPFLLLNFIITAGSYSQWASTPDSANCVLESRFFNAISADGGGGTFIVGHTSDLRYVVQKVDHTGQIVWDATQQGLVPVVPDSANDVMFDPALLLPDGEGGVYIGYNYHDFLQVLTDPEYVVIYDGDTYVQHLDKNGQRTWGNKGMPLETSKGTNPSYYNTAPSSLSAIGNDGEGGVVAVWSWYEHESTGKSIGGTYMQRIDASGSLLWGKNGRQINTLALRKAIIDNNGDVILVIARRDSSGAIQMIVAKHDVEGQLLWEKPFFAQLNEPRIIFDGAGGCYVFYYQNQHSIKAQRLDSNGNQMWGENGRDVISNFNPYQFSFDDVVKSPYGGFVCEWSEFRGDSTTRGHYVQYIDSNGQRRWGETGLPVSASPTPKAAGSRVFISDEDFLFLFGDKRKDTYYLYAQKLDKDGQRLWSEDDVLFSTRISSARHAVSDGEGGAIIAWAEAGGGVCLQKIDKFGNLGGIVSVKQAGESSIPVQYRLDQNYPNPFTTQTAIHYKFKLGTRNVRLMIYNVLGEEVITLVNKQQVSGSYSAQWSGLDKHGKRVAPGIYFYKLSIGEFESMKKLLYYKE